MAKSLMEQVKENDRALFEARAAFEAAGGRGVELAEEVDRLTRRKERLDRRIFAEVSPPIKNQKD
jgi:hypothetical protein